VRAIRANLQPRSCSLEDSRASFEKPGNTLTGRNYLIIAVRTLIEFRDWDAARNIATL